jgi:uncharacterized protein (TIGR04255 family)
MTDRVMPVSWSPASVGPLLGEPYPNAPINEAVFDVRVNRSDGLPIERLDALGGTEVDQYPTRGQVMQVGNQIVLNPEQVSSSIGQRLFGYSFRGPSQVFQVRSDGFTFSRLRPYENWSTFSSEAFRLLAKYLDAAKPFAINRIALRYINQIDVPAIQDLDLGVYLQTRPTMSPVLPQTLEGYFLTTQVQLMDPGPRLQLIETVVNPSPDFLGLILDIDVFWEETLDIADPLLDDLLHERFDLLRACKNAVFEGCVTDAARALFR